MTTADFKLKGSTIPVVVLELENYHPIDFENSLKNQIDAAPQFFHQAPVLINLEKLAPSESEIDFSALVKQCFSLGIQPVAFKSVPECYLSQVEQTGIAILSDASTPVSAKPLTAHKSSEPATAEVEAESISEPGDVKVEVQTVIEERLVHNAAMIIDKPVRSGQQIYAQASDLVVLGNVSEGAEVIADGNIHIYGILRGRALAGAKGDEAARIMCRNMDAELVSIAGNFLPSDAIDEESRHQAVQIRLVGGSLKMQTLEK